MAKAKPIRARCTIGGALEFTLQLRDDGVARDISADQFLFAIVESVGGPILVSGSTLDGRATIDTAERECTFEIPGYATASLVPGAYHAYVQHQPVVGPSPRYPVRMVLDFKYPGAA